MNRILCTSVALIVCVPSFGDVTQIDVYGSINNSPGSPNVGQANISIWGDNLVVMEMTTSMAASPVDDPTPSMVGTFYGNTSIRGIFADPGEPMTPYMQFLNDVGLHTYQRATWGHFENNDEWYNFTPDVELVANSHARLYEMSVPEPYYAGSTDINYSVMGGFVSSIQPFVTIYDEPCPWGDFDWEVSVNVSGIFTADSVTFLPEPATAILLAIGLLAVRRR